VAAQSSAGALGSVSDQKQAVHVARSIQRLVGRRQPKQVNGNQGTRVQPFVPSLVQSNVNVKVRGSHIDNYRRSTYQCTASVVAVKVALGTITASPRPTLLAINASCKASMPLPQATAKPQNVASPLEGSDLRP
jgi:hypothetical protein